MKAPKTSAREISWDARIATMRKQKNLTADGTYRPAIPPHPEAHMRFVRLPSCQDAQMYVSPTGIIHPQTRIPLRPGGTIGECLLTWHTTLQITGVRRPFDEEPPVPAACVTLSPSTASSRTVSRPELPRAPVAQRRHRQSNTSFIFLPLSFLPEFDKLWRNPLISKG